MPPANTTQRHRPETRQRRKDILRAASATFGAKGYNRASLADIAGQAGMTHPGVLHHFGSKTRLLLEVLTSRDESDVEHLETKAIPHGMDLFRHLLHTAARNEQRPTLVKTFAVLSAESVTDDHPASDYFEKRYRTLREEIADAFRTVCADSGVTDPSTIETAAAAILAVMDGLQVQWLHDPAAIPLAEASAFAVEAIVAQVLQPRATSLSTSAA